MEQFLRKTERLIFVSLSVFPISYKERFHQKSPSNRREESVQCSLQGVCPCGYDLDLGWKIRATRKPKKMAAVIPAAVAVIPPEKAPARPFSATA